MIVLDTHVWVWWIHSDPRLPGNFARYLQEQESQGLGISAISCWEIAKLVEYGRLGLPSPVAEWLEQALAYPGIRLLDLSPHIAVESTQLPGTFHRDPADQIIVATARVYACPLVTLDARIRAYPGVRIEPWGPLSWDAPGGVVATTTALFREDSQKGGAHCAALAVCRVRRCRRSYFAAW